MEKKTQESVAKTAYGKAINALPYQYSWEEYQTNDELVAAKDEMTLDEQRKTRNTERQSNARQKALSAALTAAGIVKPTAENDPQIALRDMVKTLLTVKLPDGSKKYTEESAREAASAMTGIEWVD